MPPIATVMIAMVIVMAMARLGPIRFGALRVSQVILRLLIKSALVFRIVSRPIPGVPAAIACRQDTSLALSWVAK